MLRTCHRTRQRRSSWARHSGTIFKRLTSHGQPQDARLGSTQDHNGAHALLPRQRGVVEAQREFRVRPTKGGGGGTHQSKPRSPPKTLYHTHPMFFKNMSLMLQELMIPLGQTWIQHIFDWAHPTRWASEFLHPSSLHGPCPHTSTSEGAGRRWVSALLRIQGSLWAGGT